MEGWNDDAAEDSETVRVPQIHAVQTRRGGNGELREEKAEAVPTPLSPEPPPMEKIMYARRPSPRTAKLNLTMVDIDYMRARKRYGIRLPGEDASNGGMAATPDSATENLPGKKKKKTSSKADKQAQIEAWASARVDLLQHYRNCCATPSGSSIACRVTLRTWRRLRRRAETLMRLP